MKKVKLPRGNSHGRPQTFFQGRAKIFQGEEPAFWLKTRKNIPFFPKESQNIFWPARRGGGQEPPLPSPADAHGNSINGILS